MLLLRLLQCCLIVLVLVATALPFVAATAPDADQEASVANDRGAPGAFQATKRAHDYANVKEDLLCRACVALSTDYFERVLPSLRARYDAYVSGDTTTGSYRERMIAELHESVDGLCGALKARTVAHHAAEADGASAPLSGSTKDLDEAVGIACPSSLESLDEAFTGVALAFLLPQKFATKRDDSHTNTTAPPAPYALPKAGAFCEEHKQCLPFIHYHITSIAGGAAGPKASLTQAERDTMEAKLDTVRQQRHDGGRPEAIPGDRGAGEKEPSLVQTLADPDTYRRLPERVPLTTVFSAAFWKWVLHYMFADSAVRFHLTERMTLVLGTAVALFALFAVSVCLCCREAKTTSRRPGSALMGSTDLSASGVPLVTEVHKPSVSSTRRRAPARKEV